MAELQPGHLMTVVHDSSSWDNFAFGDEMKVPSTGEPPAEQSVQLLTEVPSVLVCLRGLLHAEPTVEVSRQNGWLFCPVKKILLGARAFQRNNTELSQRGMISSRSDFMAIARDLSFAVNGTDQGVLHRIPLAETGPFYLAVPLLSANAGVRLM